MSKIWSFMIIAAIIFSVFIGKADMIIAHITKASTSAIENIFTLAGMLCFWTGIFNILKNTNMIDKLSKVVSPIMRKLFKKDEINDQIIEDVSLNVTSNLIGVGNAATVFGISATEKMQKINKDKEKPNDSMTTFILLNTASIQLIPTSIISLRILYGSVDPGGIILPVWIISICALTAGLIAIKILNRTVK